MTRYATTLLLAAAYALAHGDHGHGAEDFDPSAGFAERHMVSEHHIESFDLPAFFKLHDLNMDGVWDRDEIAALYGLRHHSVLGQEEKKTPAGLEEKIVSTVLAKLDTNHDGKISMDEFVAAGANSLPVFPEHKDLGHHYDEESEYFLHHEELYHNTPETQTDESYNHPEDIEHFRRHAEIEAEEDARERKFAGLAANADLGAEHPAPADPLEHHEHAPGDGPEALAENGEVIDGAIAERVARAARAARKNQPARMPESEAAGAKPRHRHSVQDRLRPDAPYKLKMRGGFRADEF